MDYVIGAENLTPTAEKMRRLMHYGQMFQSHALHFFHPNQQQLPLVHKSLRHRGRQQGRQSQLAAGKTNRNATDIRQPGRPFEFQVVFAATWLLPPRMLIGPTS